MYVKNCLESIKKLES